MENFDLAKINLTRYLFFSGKGGVGKTSIACAVAVGLADQGKKVLLISSDPASNLQDIFNQKLTVKGIEIKNIPGLTVANLDPEEAASEYRENVIAPYRGKLPESMILNMQEQLSGSCTVEIAAFNEFSNYMTDESKNPNFDHIIFDTAPTGHTIRMIQLPSAWSNFIDESMEGVSFMGQLSGLDKRKKIYKQAVKIFTDPNFTQLIVIARPETESIQEACRSSKELDQQGIKNQMLVINGVLEDPMIIDSISKQMYECQQNVIKTIPESLLKLTTYQIPLRSYNPSNITHIRKLLLEDSFSKRDNSEVFILDRNKLTKLIDYFFDEKRKIIFTVGKGGVGKTTLALKIAKGLVNKGANVHLITTDPTNPLILNPENDINLTLSYINETQVLKEYKEKILSKARLNMKPDDIAYVEEDLRSPYAQEIAIFETFATLIERAKDKIIVIDTSLSGHTLLLLDTNEAYRKEVDKNPDEVSKAVKNLLPRLRDKKETEPVIITLPEATPVFEAERMQKDLERAGIKSQWWIVNSCMVLTDTRSPFLKSRAKNELAWITKVKKLSANHMVLMEWRT